MKSLSLFAAVILASVVALPAAEIRVAVVDFKKAFEAHPDTATAEDRVKKSRESARDAFRDKTNALKQLLQRHQELLIQLEGLSGAAAEAKRNEASKLLEGARVLEREAADFKAVQEAELQKTFVDEKNRIRDAVSAAVRKVNANAAYHLVLDKSAMTANGMPMVVDVRDLDDITGQVITALKQ